MVIQLTTLLIKSVSKLKLTSTVELVLQLFLEVICQKNMSLSMLTIVANVTNQISLFFSGFLFLLSLGFQNHHEKFHEIFLCIFKIISLLLQDLGLIEACLF
mmetsp:Transcript_2386/g.3533  ORF Transcript_2386/g.3533 Transcript_2386/m.3533 type:complete len:102 (-) Transcript_2386:58-363(-)